MKVGFTGTRKGMNDAQLMQLWKWILTHKTEIDEFHHGDCFGADFEANALFHHFAKRIVIHPPIADVFRAYANQRMGSEKYVVLPEKEYLKRNHDIVKSVDVLIAAPFEDFETLRSGTWAAVRYARKLQVPVIQMYKYRRLDEESI